MSESEAAGDALALEQVTVRFDGVAALEDVTLELRRGELVGLIGPNGAGKTTLLNVLSGYQRPSSGRVRCGGRDVTRLSPERRARLGVGRTFQNVRLFPALSVRTNVELGALGQGTRPRRARQLADDLLDELGLAERAHDEASSLPYGSERLLGIARALAGEPRFLLLDEPAAGLDEEEGEDLIRRIRRVRERFGCGVLIIEHDMHLIMTLSERIHVLDYGKTLASGSPEQVRSDPAVIRAYFGDPQGVPHAAAHGS